MMYAGQETEREELSFDLVETGEIADAAQPLPLWMRIANNGAFRRACVLIALAAAWEIGAALAANPLMFPTLHDTIVAGWQATLTGELPARVWSSLQVLAIGYAAGIGAAALLTVFAIATPVGADILSTLSAMFNPLPALALLPLALLWFGLGLKSMIFIMVQSVVWTVSMNTFSGFLSVSPTLRMVGQNFGLRGLPYVIRILIPAAFPFILVGLRQGWAFSWRTLIGAELVFGVAARSGGLGWFIFENRAELETGKVFAGLLMVLVIGFVVENVIFRTLESRTVRRWGMLH